MSFFGFAVTFLDGTTMREGGAAWNDVPYKPIARLAIIEILDDGVWRERIALDPKKGRRFFFYNEVVSIRGGLGVLAAKGIGFIEADRVTEARLDFLPSPSVAILRMALQPLLSRMQRLSRKRWFLTRTAKWWRNFGSEASAAAEALIKTERDVRLSWKTYPATDEVLASRLSSLRPSA